MEHCDLELLSLAVDSELDDAARARVEDHLVRCEACRRLRDDLVALGGRIRDAAPAADVVAHRRALRDTLAHRPEPLWRRRVALPAPVFVILVAVFAVALAFAIVSRRRDEPTPVPIAEQPPAAEAPDLSRFDRGNRLEIYVARHGREER
jgi:anti-sigma factor RsiW